MSSYATATIAGVALEDDSIPCKNLIIDGANVRPDHVGVTRYAASGNVLVQVLPVSVGARFGIRAEFIPASVLDAIITAINSAMNGGAGSFNVTAEDEAQSIDANCVPDYESGWIQYDGNQRMHEDAIKGVVFRFVTV